MSLFLVGCAFKPSGGGSTQTVADEVKAGQPISIRLELTVWGGGGTIKGRYTNPMASYKYVGANEYSMTSAQLISESEKSAVYEIHIPTLSTASGSAIEYYIETKFDGQVNRIPGIKTVRVD